MKERRKRLRSGVRRALNVLNNNLRISEKNIKAELEKFFSDEHIEKKRAVKKRKVK